MSNVVRPSPWIFVVIVYVIVCMFAISQVEVPRRDYIFNSACKYNCWNHGSKCDFALMKISANKVPASAQKAALQVYKWSDEAGENMEIYGYGNTGRADEFPTVSVPLQARCCMIYLELKFAWRRAPLYIPFFFLIMFEKVRRCHQMLDAEDVGQRLFRHAQNVVTSVSQSILKYKMDCTIPPPRLLEGLSSAGDSGGYVGDDMVVISMWT